MKLWEAARATMATPRLFKPFYHDPTKQIYCAATAEHLNPIYIADSERRIFKQDLQCPEAPDLMVSLGAGVEEALVNHSSCSSSMVSEIPPKCACTTVDSSSLRKRPKRQPSFASCQTTSDAFVHDFPSSDSSHLRFVRFNPPANTKLPRSDDLDELEALSTSASGLIDKTEVRRLAAKLLATLFYYEPVGDLAQQANGAWMSTGMIRCRIPNDTHEMTALGALMRKKNTVKFIIRAESGKVLALDVEDDVMADMIDGKFTLPPIEIDVPQRSTNLDMMLSFDRTDHNSISGFPRALGNMGNKTNRHRIALSSQRSDHGSTKSSLRSRSTAQSWQPPAPVRKASPAPLDGVSFSPLAAGVGAGARGGRRRGSEGTHTSPVLAANPSVPQDNEASMGSKRDRLIPSEQLTRGTEHDLARSPNFSSGPFATEYIAKGQIGSSASSSVSGIDPRDVVRSVKLMSTAESKGRPMDIEFGDEDDGIMGGGGNGSLKAMDDTRASLESLRLDIETRRSGESIQQLEQRLRQLERIIRSKERINAESIRDSLKDEIFVGRAAGKTKDTR